MCEFCHKHGEGRKWYLEASNYSEDLLSDVRRRRFVERFFTDPGSIRDATSSIGTIAKLPRLIRNAFYHAAAGSMKRIHYGQVVPLEEIRQIFGFVNSIVRVACLCRHYTLGAEKRYCYGVSMAPAGGYLGDLVRGASGKPVSGPYASGLEQMTREEALDALEDHERQGMCHTVWTFHTPFICGICNCDRKGCFAVRAITEHGFPTMFRAEHVAVVSPDSCSGCRKCTRVCQFGAIAFDPAGMKAVIDPARCFGCGICRSMCSFEAIRLLDRSAVPEAAGVW
jgi:Pyruvate/2-oxoacid:ferredoxin oxidoreductase delta subunit